MNGLTRKRSAWLDLPNLPNIYDKDFDLRNIEELFSKAFDNFDTRGSKYPPVNVYYVESDPEVEPKIKPHYVVEVAAAGFHKDCLTLEVNDSIVTIRGGSMAEGSGKIKVSQVIKEIAYRNFERSFKFHVPVEVADAEFKDGLLTFKVYPKQPEEGKKITIA